MRGDLSANNLANCVVFVASLYNMKDGEGRGMDSDDYESYLNGLDVDGKEVAKTFRNNWNKIQKSV